MMHKWSTELVRSSSAIEMVRPRCVKDAMKSGRGTEKEWGAAVDTKAMFNRAVLSQAPATAAQMIRYKAEEAGVALTEIESAHLDVGSKLVEVAKASSRVRRQVKRLKQEAAWTM